MSFTSPAFLPFLLAVAVLTALVARRLAWLPLLLASYVFYALVASPALLGVLAGVTLVAYALGLALSACAAEGARRRLLWCGVGLLVATLGFFRYLGWLPGGGLGLLGSGGKAFLSIGVSYYVVQAISYLVDVHDEAAPAERHLGRFALYLAFFPKLIQGPIERAPALLPQLASPAPATAADRWVALQLLLWGAFQKTVIADALGPYVQAAYGDLGHRAALSILLATYLFALQLYFDFAGYSDMAVGIARLFGIRLTQNFRSPYLSTSVAEFWRRWHISFSSWLQDYVFRPLQLGMRRWRTWGNPLALLATFAVSGLWHGAAATFLAWGLLHGLYLSGAILLRPALQRLRLPGRLLGPRGQRALDVLVTFHLVCFAWIPFRAGSLADFGTAVRVLLTRMPASVAQLLRGEDLDQLLFLGQGKGALALAAALMVAAIPLRAHFTALAGDAPRPGPAAKAPPAPLAPLSPWVAAVVYGAMLYLVAFSGAATQAFLYAQY